jgi:outer membrane protein assembly factor BamB
MVVPLLAQPVSAQVDEPWPMFKQNPLRTGVTTGTGPTNLAVKWEVMTNGPITSSPAVAYGNVYIGSQDKNVYCFDADDGSLVWKYPTNYRVRSSPTVKDGKVYVGPDDGNVYCLDADDGSLIWEYETIGGKIVRRHALNIMAPQSSPAVVGERLFVGHLDGYVYCLGANNGTLLWSYETNNYVCSSPTVFGGNIYIGSNDGFVYCLRETDGKMIWNFDTTINYIGTGTRTVHGSGTICEDLNMVVFFAETNGIYYAFDLTTGDVIWQFAIMRRRPYIYGQTTQSRTVMTPTYVAETGSLYVTDNSCIQLLDAATGEPDWAIFPQGPGFWDIPFQLQEPGPSGVPTGEISGLGFGEAITPADTGFPHCSSPAYVDGKLYVGGHRHCTYVFDANAVGKATRLSWYQTGGWLDSSPAIAYGNMFIGTTHWDLFCFEEGSQRPLDPSDPTRTVPLLPATSVTGQLSTTTLNVDEWIYVEGKINYAPDAQVWERALVFADFTRPDGTKWKANMMADWDGTYKIAFRPDMEGTWTVKPRWLGDIYNAGSQGTALTFTVTSASPSSTVQQSSSLSMLGILAAPALLAMPIAAVLYKRKKK